MKNRVKNRFFLVLAGVAGLTLTAFSLPANAAAICGPGSHWVDTCSADTDKLDTIIEFGIDTTLDGNPEVDAFFGDVQTIVERSDPLDDSIFYPGTRPIDGHLDVIDTEILSATNATPAFIPGLGNAIIRIGTDAGVPLPTLGNIAEQPGDPFWADSFFDVFFEIDMLDLGFTLYNQIALRVETKLDRIPPPPGTDYVAPLLESGGYLELYRKSDDAHIANLTRATSGRAHHQVVPEPPILLLMIIGVSGLIRKRIRGIRALA